MKKAHWKAVTLALGVLATHDAAAENRRLEYRIFEGMGKLFAQGDCEGIRTRLNRGLAEQLPSAQLVAGVLFDEGICMKADWDKAVQFYTSAHEGGDEAAALRLAAGFAAPEHGPDLAAALWWMARAKPSSGIKGCETPADTHGDPDRFVAYLKTWSQQKIRACTYAVGFVATAVGEIQYPLDASLRGAGGNYTLRFVPATGRIAVAGDKIEEFEVAGVHRDHSLSKRASEALSNQFVANISRAALRARDRYPRPEGLDPGWQFDIRIRFQVTN